MKKIFFTLCFACAIATLSFSQDFNSAVGLRLGYPLSVTYKTFISENSAVEGYAGIRGFGNSVRLINASAAYQIHKDIEEVEQLQWYYGAGASVYLWSGSILATKTSFGVSGYAGLSYTFTDIPLNVSLDWVPTFFIGGNTGFARGFGAGYGSLAARYILSSDNN